MRSHARSSRTRPRPPRGWTRSHACRTGEAGVPYIYPALGLTLRDRQRAYFYQQLDRSFPGLKQKYIARYGTRYQCASPHARQLWTVFTRACDEVGIFYRMRDITRRYQRGFGCGQLSFF